MTVLGVWLGGHIHHNMLCEVILEHQDVGDSRQLIQLNGHLYAGKIYDARGPREWWPLLGVEVP